MERAYMGYRKYAKDYIIDYVPVKGKKREKPVRTYIGPYFRFRVSPQRVAWLRRFYLAGLLVQALLLSLPLVLDSAVTRIWYVVFPGTCAWIPWTFAACACWRLWTAGEKVDREHNDLLHDRMAGSTLFLLGLTLGSAVGCILALSKIHAAAADYAVCVINLFSAICAMLLFGRRKELEMVAEENPEARTWETRKKTEGTD